MVQATQLVGENIRVATKKKASVKDIIGLAGTNIIGTEIIKLESGLIAGL